MKEEFQETPEFLRGGQCQPLAQYLAPILCPALLPRSPVSPSAVLRVPMPLWHCHEVTQGNLSVSGCFWLYGGWRQTVISSEGKQVILGSSPAAELQR